MNLRLASGIALAALATPVAAVETALDPSFGFAPLVLNGPTFDGEVRANIGITSKYVDQGVTLCNDVALVGGIGGRILGFGLHGAGAIALGEDTRDAMDTDFPDTIAANVKIDWLGQVQWAEDIPLLTVNPYFEWITYPVQSSEVGTWENDLKDRQRWLGADLWFAPPISGWEGIEFGGGLAYNTAVGVPMLRGGAGARQLFAFDGFQLTGYQIANFGNRRYHQELTDPAGVESSHTQGLTTVAVGGEVLLPLPVKEWYVTFGASVNAWAADRSDVEDNLGQNATEYVLGFGLEWHPAE
jgi:hypothetical protein